MAGVNSGIPTFYVQQFSSNIQLKLQQKGSVLRECVMSGMHVGSQASPVDQFGAVSANKVTSRYAPIVQVDAPTDRRWVFPQDYDLAQLLDNFDKLRLLIDPMSSYVENAVNALGRSMDSEILSGLINTNSVGVAGAGTASLASSQIVNVATGSTAATNLTVAKLRAAKKIMMANYVNFAQDEVYCAINAANHDSLLAEVQIISADFNSPERPILEEGMVTRFLGINFIHTELLFTGTDDAAGTSTAVPMWAKSGSYLGIWNDLNSKITERPDLESIPYQAYVKGTFGGTRLEEKKVVKIWAR